MQNKVDRISKSDTPLTHWRSPGVRYKKGPGWVYFIRSGDAIKIGFTVNVALRLSTLQSGNPNVLELLGAVRGSVEDERRTHEMFSRLHIRGEWFREHPAILEYVAASDRQRRDIRNHGSTNLAQLIPLPAHLAGLV